MSTLYIVQSHYTDTFGNESTYIKAVLTNKDIAYAYAEVLDEEGRLYWHSVTEAEVDKWDTELRRKVLRKMRERRKGK